MCMYCYVVSDLNPDQCERGTIFAVTQGDFNGPARPVVGVETNIRR